MKTTANNGLKQALILLTLLVGLALISSCSKEEIETPTSDCNCGIITEEKKLQSIPYNHWYYTMDIRNNCTGNIEEFDSSFQVWSDYEVGDEYCRGSQW